MKRSAWTLILESHMRRQGITQSDIARNIGVSQATVSDYMIGDLKPPLRHLTTIADCLGLIGQERVTFIEEAHLCHAPDRLRDMVGDLRARIHKLERIVRENGLKTADV